MFRREDYPPEWEEISHFIRFVRADGKCEVCGVKHLAVGARDKYNHWHDEHDIHHMQSDCGYALFGDFPKMTKIVLTTAHLGVPKIVGHIGPLTCPQHLGQMIAVYAPGNKHDKMDCRHENLMAMCQACHLNFDREDHIANLKRTNQRKRRQLQLAKGIVPLPGMWEHIR